MLPDERIAAADLAGDGFSVAVARISEAHEGIADRVFGQLGAAAAPVRATHDAIAAVDVHLSADEIELLEKPYQPHAVVGFR